MTVNWSQDTNSSVCNDVVSKKYVEDEDAAERRMKPKRTLLISKKHKSEAEQRGRQKLQEEENGNRVGGLFERGLLWQHSVSMATIKIGYVCAHRATVDGQRDTSSYSATDIDHENVASHYYGLFDIPMSPVHK